MKDSTIKNEIIILLVRQLCIKCKFNELTVRIFSIESTASYEEEAKEEELTVCQKTSFE